MAKFEFQLEAVLAQRKHIEQVRQRELSKQQEQMTTLQIELKRMNDEVVGATNDLRENRLVGRIDLAFLAAHRRYILATQRKGTVLMQRMSIVQKLVDEARTAWAEAAKQRKIIEKLREKAMERWKIDQSRRELAEQDEVNTRPSHALQGEG